MKYFVAILMLIFAGVCAAQTMGTSVDKEKAEATAERIRDIQKELRKEKLDGWLFYDFRGSDPLMPRIFLTERASGSRRWYYYVPANGEPTKVVHAIEPYQLDRLPGKKLIYREWQLIGDNLKKAFYNGKQPTKKLRVAMQYSPNNDIPYISRVDAGTVEM